jgi:hypothetical protein
LPGAASDPIPDTVDEVAAPTTTALMTSTTVASTLISTVAGAEPRRRGGR